MNLLRAALLHVRARGWRRIVLGALASTAIEVVGLHRSVFLPFSITSTIRLTPLLAYPFAAALALLADPRLFTLDVRGGRERAVRLVALSALLTLSALAMSAVAGFREPDTLMLIRNLLCALGVLLILATVVDLRLALLVVGVLVFLYGYFGSQRTGEPRTWAWLLQSSNSHLRWTAALLCFIAGLAVDVSSVTTDAWEAEWR